MINTILIMLAGFAGFSLGRFGDRYFGYLEYIWIIPVPHHWIWGAIISAVGIYFKNYYIISFGIGLFISDLNDFFRLRFIGEEPLHKWRFWSIE
jgi:hypothetical protein